MIKMNKTVVGVIDCGRGNLRSVVNSIKALGAETKLIDRPENIDEVEHLVFPGVGAFEKCMNFLNESGMDRAILKYIEKGKPFLGICLGFQILFEKSEEFGIHKGLGIFKGMVKHFPTTQKIPHMGWNNIQIKKNNKLLRDIPDNSYFYFVHSYFVQSEDDKIISCETDYGVNFISMVNRENIFGTQFHPEKSQTFGLTLLKNFIALP